MFSEMVKKDLRVVLAPKKCKKPILLFIESEMFISCLKNKIKSCKKVI